jgi:hypothetical protein
MNPDRKPQTYWLNDWEGKARGGLYVRNDLVNHIKKLEEQGLKVVGVEFDGTWNLQLITEVPELVN